MLFEVCKKVLTAVNVDLFNRDKVPIEFSDEAIKKVIRRKKYRTKFNVSDEGILEVTESDRHSSAVLLVSFFKDVYKETKNEKLDNNR